MKPPFIVHSNVVVRTPRLPFIAEIDEEKISALVEDNLFMESIYLASPVLYKECMKYKGGEIQDEKERNKIKKSLTKYYLRTIGRCTPFGLFSGCSIGEWKNGETDFTLTHKTKRHTRFDMHYLCSLAQHLSKEQVVKENLIYYTNNSLYNLGDETRFVEYKYLYGRRIHQISSANHTDYLSQITEEGKNGITLSGVRNILNSLNFNTEEIEIFIDELLEAQILTSELEPSITGDEFQYQILSTIKKINQKYPSEKLTGIIEILEVANDKIREIDNAEHNTSQQYKEIMDLLDDLGVTYEESKLFQTDLIFENNLNGVSYQIQDDLFEAVKILNSFSSYHRTNPNIASFAKRFTERYEDKQIPLPEVLDTETGIGYLINSGEDIAPLVEDILIPSKQNLIQNYRQTPIDRFLSEKIKKASILQEIIIEIKDEEIKPFVNNNWEDLPPSMHLLFRMVEDSGKNNLYIDSCGSSSAINLLGRFAHADTRIYELAKDIIEMEEKTNPDVQFAEIVHLPESRIGNVLLHPAFRNLEIPYLAKSSLNIENQILIDDILVCVKRGEICLQHSKTGKIIIPRLSNAHNYQNNALPIYQFLCDLQINNLRGSIGFHWSEVHKNNTFLPRIQYNNIILSRATWRLTKQDIESLVSKGPTTNKLGALNEFLRKNNIPNKIVLADGDNELFIDFENDIMANLFVETIKNRNVIELKEFLGVGQAIKNENNEFFNNQILASLIKTTPTYRNLFQSKNELDSSVPDLFIPGSEWLYYKIYCGAKSADRILTEAIKPIVELLLDKGVINNFFFIRYNDPDFHIRFRVRLNSENNYGEVVKVIYKHLLPFSSSSHIWKIQSDTYKREIARYGVNTIGIAEKIFFYDSLSVLEMLNETWGDEREQIRWLWAMRAIEELLEVFRYSLEEKLVLIRFMKEAFAKEFNSNKFLKDQLNSKFRRHRIDIEKMMSIAINANNNSWGNLAKILYTKSEKLQGLASEILELKDTQKLKITLNELLYSYIHMLVNRITTSKPRLHEMVIYDFLYRHYRAEAGRGGLQIKELLNEVVPF